MPSKAYATDLQGGANALIWDILAISASRISNLADYSQSTSWGSTSDYWCRPIS
jgi:hypothetical protein